MSSIFANEILKQFSCLEDVSIKTFFGGFSINSKQIMFGWIDKQNFYLRGHAFYRSIFIELGMQPLNLPAGIATKQLDYYKVSDDLLKDHQKLLPIVKMVIEYAELDLHEKIEQKQKRIKSLPNITFSLEKLLYSVGITDLEKFIEIGYLEAFYRIKNKKPDISSNLLFTLYGSLNGRHVASLSETLIKEIEKDYQSFLEKKSRY